MIQEKDVNFLMENFLHDCGYKWTEIGDAIGFRYGEIKTIENAVRGDANKGLRELLMKWSKWPIKSHTEKPTLEKLCDALRSNLVGLGDVARCLDQRRNEL